VARGENPRVVASKVRRALEITRWRALTISRTEILRAHRYATLISLQQNERIVAGWVWLSAMDRNTCPYCWAMTGTHHTSEEELGSHPNCRCAMIPDVKSWDEILGRPAPTDLPDLSTTGVVPDGSEAFAGLPAAEQREVLGAKAYKAYKAGSISLQTLVGTRHSRDYGRVGYTKSMRQVNREKAYA
jgi:SPP1 gp7 family putative phage head morphogenesis protein